MTEKLIDTNKIKDKDKVKFAINLKIKTDVIAKINQIDWPRFIETADKKWRKPVNNIDNMSIYLKLE